MPKETLQSLERAFLLIELLAKNGAMGVRELAHAAALNSTVTHRLLSTLTALGYAGQDEETGKYMLTYKLTALGSQIHAQNSVVKLAHPFLKQLSEQCRETVHFVERAGTNIRYIDKITPAANMFATGSYIGLELPLAGTAAGKAILAGLPEQEIDAIWAESHIVPYTPYTLTTLERLQEELSDCRRTGFAYDREEREMGLMCIGVSLQDYKGRARYGISISAPIARLQDERLEQIQKALMDTRERIAAVIS